MKNIAVIGSRKFSNLNLIDIWLSRLSIKFNKNIKIISGGAIGPDKYGEDWAKKHNLETKIYKPNWKKFGKRAGLLRNDDIIESSDIILAFWDGTSKGTKYSISLAKNMNKKLFIIFEDGSFKLEL